MAATHKIVLLKFEDVYKARPAYVVAEPSDKVRFLNFTDATIELTFPDGLFDSGGHTLAAGGGWEATVPSDAAAGHFVYAGTVSGAVNSQLQGESSPEIIIDRFGLPQNYLAR
jgi:hypothetical protein